MIGDPVYPGRKAALALESAQAPKYFHKHILRQFFRILPVAYQAEDEQMNLSAVSIQEASEAGRIAC
jgi:hypothetical protein